jgi:hypothetical protein
VIGGSNTNRSELFVDQELTDQLDDVEVPDRLLTANKSQTSFAPKYSKRGEGDNTPKKATTKRIKEDLSSHHSEAARSQLS